MDADFILIQRMRHGDNAAFDLFINKYYADILRYCLHHCCDKETAKDLTQETFMKFFERFSKYTHKGKAKNYLYVIASNKYRDHYKKMKEQPFNSESLTVLLEQEAQPPDDLNLAITIHEYLRKLPDEFTEVLVLRYYQDLKLSEIAEILDIGQPLVKYRLKRGKEILEKMLHDGGIE
ncbi:RNA polymerase sigma factor [Pseudoramibacter faecis]|uniref:RNA polymerase sigma factor n=1 Tax=Pseudoramibacter faecis TaxID=3108534 RepID=UPI002E7969E0|nr:RNA polymerase sigma factor [Pseudoramibacter sp. HA2172]